MPEKRHSRGEGRRAGKGLPRIGGREHAAHEPLISSLVVAEVPLAGLALAGCGKSLPPQDAAIGDPQKPRLFGVSPKWKKAMDGFFHGQLAGSE